MGGGMNGQEHWRKAEDHLAKAAAIETDGDQDSTSAWHQRQAQAHATLAAAAAVIATGAHKLGPADLHDWRMATEPEYAAAQAAEASG